MSFPIEIILNRASEPAILPEAVNGFQTVLKLGLSVQDASELLRVQHSWTHGHVAAVLGACRQLGLEHILHRRSRQGEELLQTTERTVEDLAAPVRSGRLPGEAAIGRQLGEHSNRYKVRKHFASHVTARILAFERKPDSVAADARLDGLYAIRTSLPDLAVVYCEGSGRT